MSAADLNGNEVCAVINIKKTLDGGDISNFKVVPDNKKVTVSWDDVPGAESYSLLEASFGMEVDDVTSPYVCDGLTNGEIYRFQLTAHMPEGAGDDAVSALVEKMPLSGRSLAPHIKDESYTSVTIGWTDLPNVSDYVVERSLSSEGPWKVSGIRKTNEYTDDDTTFDTAYYYRVTPMEFDDVASDYEYYKKARFWGYPTVGEIGSLGWALDVAVSGNYAYVADYHSGLAIIDIGDPSNPGCPLYINMGITPTIVDVIVSGCFIYAADEGNGLAIVDINDPEDPGMAMLMDISALLQDVAISDSFVYIADGGGLIIIDISIPSNPGALVHVDTASSAEGVAVSGNYAYVADYSSGLAIIDISDPTHPGEWVYVDTTGHAMGVAVSGVYAYVADGYSGLTIIDLLEWRQ